MKKIIQITVLGLVLAGLSGCIALAAGAAGGYYVAKNYNININKKSA